MVHCLCRTESLLNLVRAYLCSAAFYYFGFR